MTGLWDNLEEAEARFDATPWKVSIEVVDCSVHVYPSRGGIAQSGVFVNPPNMLERKVGVTIEQKIARAKAKIQNVVDRLEHERQETNRLKAVAKAMREGRP